MKKVLVLLLVGIMLLPFFGCKESHKRTRVTNFANGHYGHKYGHHYSYYRSVVIIYKPVVHKPTIHRRQRVRSGKSTVLVYTVLPIGPRPYGFTRPSMGRRPGSSRDSGKNSSRGHK